MKSAIPETRSSLILRLADKEDVDAWREFIAIYEPLVYRLARVRGLQDADAWDFSQEVLVAVSQAVHRWEPDPDRGRFRDWLFRIARNMMIKFLTRRRYRSIGTGDSRTSELLDQHVDPSTEAIALFDLEYQRQVYRWAAQLVRRRVHPKTWSAFAMIAIEGKSTSDVSQELGMSAGAIYIACSRVRKRMRDLVADHESRAEHDDI